VASPRHHPATKPKPDLGGRASEPAPELVSSEGGFAMKSSRAPGAGSIDPGEGQPLDPDLLEPELAAVPSVLGTDTAGEEATAVGSEQAVEREGAEEQKGEDVGMGALLQAVRANDLSAVEKILSRYQDRGPASERASLVTRCVYRWYHRVCNRHPPWQLHSVYVWRIL
jgi:hypothetical protein